MMFDAQYLYVLWPPDRKMSDCTDQVPQMKSKDSGCLELIGDDQGQWSSEKQDHQLPFGTGPSERMIATFKVSYFEV